MEKQRDASVGWFGIADGMLAEAVAQPAGVELIPFKDGLEISATEQQWKARATGFELRVSADDDGGMYKIAGGRAARLGAGNFLAPVILSTAGRWAVAASYSNETYRHVLARVDLATGKSYPTTIDDYRQPIPIVAIGSRVLVKLTYGEDRHHHGYEDEEMGDRVADDVAAESLFLFDPATGVMQQAAGEFRPLAQTTFRNLQPTGKPNEFWAAILGEHGETLVGTYDTRTFTFRTVTTLPKISFNSMKMYVDEPANKVYFVYRGHLLATPLRKAETRP